VRVHQQVLRLDVAVAHAQAVGVRERAAHLEHVQLHEQRGHALAGLGVVLADAVHRLRHKLEHQVEVHLVLRAPAARASAAARRRAAAARRGRVAPAGRTLSVVL